MGNIKNGLTIRKQHPLHENNFDFNNASDFVNNFNNNNFLLINLLKDFSIEKPYVSRYSSPSMPLNLSISQLKQGKKQHVLQHNQNKINQSNKHHLSRVYKNSNLRHSSYSSQSVYSNKTNNNIKNFERIGNSLIFKGQSLNSKQTQRLSFQNGGGFKNDKNYHLLNYDPNLPVTNVHTKRTQHEAPKYNENHTGNRLKIF